MLQFLFNLLNPFRFLYSFLLFHFLYCVSIVLLFLLLKQILYDSPFFTKRCVNSLNVYVSIKQFYIESVSDFFQYKIEIWGQNRYDRYETTIKTRCTVRYDAGNNLDSLFLSSVVFMIYM